ncbi:MAG: hypothetical protein OEW05_08750, partial [Candidatus Aminicenantes bacterium]|nr:hypothetical protein [Candidatus Aminicenantes bacterium]
CHLQLPSEFLPVFLVQFSDAASDRGQKHVFAYPDHFSSTARRVSHINIFIENSAWEGNRSPELAGSDVCELLDATVYKNLGLCLTVLLVLL